MSAMTAAEEYRRATYLAALAEELQQKGYEVVVRPQGELAGLDLVATRQGRKTAYRVGTIRALQATEEETTRLGRLVRPQGMDFFLRIIPPPHELILKVVGLDKTLRQYLNDNPPADWRPAGPGGIDVKRVADLRLDVLEVDVGEVHVVGTAAVVVDLEGTAYDDFPMSFDVVLGPDLAIKTVRSLHVRITDEDGMPQPASAAG